LHASAAAIQGANVRIGLTVGDQPTPGARLTTVLFPRNHEEWPTNQEVSCKHIWQHSAAGVYWIKGSTCRYVGTKVPRPFRQSVFCLLDAKHTSQLQTHPSVLPCSCPHPRLCVCSLSDGPMNSKSIGTFRSSRGVHGAHSFPGGEAALLHVPSHARRHEINYSIVMHMPRTCICHVAVCTVNMRCM
jgi:hypothetical protein